MPDLLLSLEIAIGLLIAVVGGYVLAMTLRRRAISRGNLLTMCAFARDGATSWRHGYIRFGEGLVEWYPLGGLSVRPRHSWRRRELDLGQPTAVGPGEGLDFIASAVSVPCRHGEQRFRLALAEAAYTALRSWVESAPPGGTNTVT